MSRWTTFCCVAMFLMSGCSEPAETPPTGEILYLRHCASCHGLGGGGDGPVAASLSRSPADLTALSERNGGRFDEAGIMQIIDGRREVVEHGTREMPVWGELFERELEGERHGSYVAMLHVRSLTDYLRSLQRAPRE